MKKNLFCLRRLRFILFDKSIVVFPSSTILFQSLFPALPSSPIPPFHLSFSSSPVYCPTFHFPCNSLSPLPLPPSLPIHFRTPFLFSCPLHPSFTSPLAPLSPAPALQAVVDGTETSVVLQHLSALTEYQLAVFAVYANEASEALRGTETTRKFILTHKHTGRNVLTRPHTNDTVSIWDRELITEAQMFDSRGSLTYWKCCTRIAGR